MLREIAEGVLILMGLWEILAGLLRFRLAPLIMGAFYLYIALRILG